METQLKNTHGHFIEVFNMTRLEKLEQDIRNLGPEELAALRDWFRRYEADRWDRQIEKMRGAGSWIVWRKMPWQPTKPEGHAHCEAFRLVGILGRLRTAPGKHSRTGRS